MTAATFKPLRYSGTMRIGRWTSNTNFGGYDKPVNFMDLTIMAQGTLVPQIDNGITYFGQNKSLNFQPKPTKVSYKLDEANSAILADLVRGYSSTFSQTAASAQPATITLIKDKAVDVGTRNIGNVAIDALIFGTDFEVDGPLGLITALTDTAVGLQSLTFNKGAIAGEKIVAGNNQITYLGMLGLIKDQNSGEMGILEIPKIAIDPKTALDLIASKGNLELQFDAETIIVEGKPLFTFFPTLSFTAPA